MMTLREITNNMKGRSERLETLYQALTKIVQRDDMSDEVRLMVDDVATQLGCIVDAHETVVNALEVTSNNIRVQIG